MAEAWRLVEKAPGSLIVLCLVPLIAELAIQQVPVAGVVASKLVVPWLGIGVWFGLDRLARGERVRASCLVAGLRAERRAAAVTLVVSTLIGFVTQVLVSRIVYGEAALGLVVGELPPVAGSFGFALVTLLPAFLPGAILGLAPGFAAFDGMRPAAALARSATAVVRAAPAFAILMLVQAALFAISLACLAIPLVVLMPWSAAASYAAYRDMRACGPRAP